MIVSERAPPAALDVVLGAPVGAEDHQRLRLARVGRRRAGPCRASAPGRARARPRPCPPRGRRPPWWPRRRRRSRGRRRAGAASRVPGRGMSSSIRRSAGGARLAGGVRRAGSSFTNSTSACRYWPSDRIDTHSSGPWWPAPVGPHSTAGTPASRNEIASEAPSRPTEICSSRRSTTIGRSPRRAPARRGCRGRRSPGWRWKIFVTVAPSQGVDAGEDLLGVLARAGSGCRRRSRRRRAPC